MASTDKIALLEIIRKIGLEDGNCGFLEGGAESPHPGCDGSGGEFPHWR